MPFFLYIPFTEFLFLFQFSRYREVLKMLHFGIPSYLDIFQLIQMVKQQYYRVFFRRTQQSRYFMLPFYHFRNMNQTFKCIFIYYKVFLQFQKYEIICTFFRNKQINDNFPKLNALFNCKP